jgi:hypothetical protein
MSYLEDRLLAEKADDQDLGDKDLALVVDMVEKLGRLFPEFIEPIRRDSFSSALPPQHR